MDTIKKTDLITERPVTPEDVNFILATMLRGLYYGKSVFSSMKKKTFMEKYHEFLTKALRSPNVKIKVACLKDAPTRILGYIIISQDETVLHWMFCRKPWRQIDVITDLLPTTIQKVTHLTQVGAAIAKTKNWEFDPFLL